MENCEIRLRKEATEAILKMIELQRQIECPSRQGMIIALSSAQATAGEDIKKVEVSQGETVLTPWENISDNTLYKKLTQYQLGLRNYCINKVGHQIFEEIKKEMEKRLDDKAN